MWSFQAAIVAVPLPLLVAVEDPVAVIVAVPLPLSVEVIAPSCVFVA